MALTHCWGLFWYWRLWLIIVRIWVVTVLIRYIICWWWSVADDELALVVVVVCVGLVDVVVEVGLRIINWIANNMIACSFDNNLGSCSG